MKKEIRDYLAFQRKILSLKVSLRPDASCIELPDSIFLLHD